MNTKSLYKVILLGNARKNLFQLPNHDRKKIIEKLSLITTNIRSLDIKKLNGFKTLYRIRCGDYRIIFKYNSTEQEILIPLICHRKEVYKVVKNRAYA